MNKEELQAYIESLFSDPLQSLHMADIYEAVKNHFDIADNDPLMVDEGHHSHGIGLPANGLDKLVGLAVWKLQTDGIIKLVGTNIYQNSSGPLPEALDTRGKKSARTRQGVSHIIPSVKILRGLNKDDDTIVSELVNCSIGQSNGWTAELVKKAIEYVNRT